MAFHAITPKMQGECVLFVVVCRCFHQFLRLARHGGLFLIDSRVSVSRVLL